MASTGEKKSHPSHQVTSCPLPRMANGGQSLSGSRPREHHTRLMQEKTGPRLGVGRVRGDGVGGIAPQGAGVTGDCSGTKRHHEV